MSSDNQGIPDGFEEHLERAAKKGAQAALKEIGLGDEGAGQDIRQLRDWLDNMRIIRNGFTQTTIRIFTVAFWLTLIGGVIAYLKEHLK